MNGLNTDEGTKLLNLYSWAISTNTNSVTLFPARRCRRLCGVQAVHMVHPLGHPGDKFTNGLKADGNKITEFVLVDMGTYSVFNQKCVFAQKNPREQI